MTPTISPPRGASKLIDMRKRGVVPDVPILVSLIGPLRHGNVTLIAEHDRNYDWRSVAGLEVEVFVNRFVPWQSVLLVLRELAAVVPARMVLTFTEGPMVECGEWRQITDFKLFDWFPIAVGPVCWPEGTKLARRILAELGKSLPIPYDQAVDLFLKAQTEAR